MKHLKRVLSLALVAALTLTSLPSSSLEAIAANKSEIQIVSSEETDVDAAKADEEDTSSKSGETKSEKKDEEGIADAPTGDSGEETNPEADPEDTPQEEETGEEIPAGEESSYENYFYGDPDYSGNYIWGYDEEGNEIPELYCDDLDEIIRMAEEGMDLSSFFADTIFENFTLDALQQMQEEGYTLDEISYLYLSGNDLPDWLLDAFGEEVMEFTDYSLESFSLNSISLLSDEPTAVGASGGPSALTANGVTQMSIDSLGVITSLGGTASHGPVYRLKAKGNDGQSYGAFCAKYGGSYRTGYSYSPTTYQELGMTNYQYNLIRTVINTYYKATGQQDLDFAAAQLIIWYILHNMPDDTKYFDPDYAWTYGGMQEGAIKIGGVAYADFVRRTILSYSNYINQWWDAGADDAALESVSFIPDYYPGELAEIYFWKCGDSNAQYIITWDINGVPTTPLRGTEIPYINNYYLDKEAVTRYNVELTKESIITNELLEGFQFEVVESKASGHDLDYNIIKGASSSYGTDYPDATTGTFGQTTSVVDPVPYMDDDVQPSGGAHKTVITTDANGYASTTFVHKHTFREFYSECMDGSNQLIDYDTYTRMWEDALKEAKNAEETDPGSEIEVTYKGSMVEMTYDEIKAIYDAQQVVYTQTQEEAQDTIDTQYSAYVARTYTYTVTELDTYTRPAATDSNGKTLDQINLPKDGYRKDVADTTTIGSYVKVVPNGGTMTAGGTNDQDENSKEKNVTNEPWQNQIFINKTDLETNSQILYDTYFDIYEYYQFKVNLVAAEKKIDVADLFSQMENEKNISIDPEMIKAAELEVRNDGGVSIQKTAVDITKLKAAIAGGDRYTISFKPEAEDEYAFTLSLTLDQSLSTKGISTQTFVNAKLVKIGANADPDTATDPDTVIDSDAETAPADDPAAEATAYMLQKPVYVQLDITEGTDGVWNVAGGGTVRSISEAEENGGVSVIEGPLQYEYTDADGNVLTLSAADDMASVDADIDVVQQSVTYTFSYLTYDDTGFLFTEKEEGGYQVTDASGNPVQSYSIDGDTYTVSVHVGDYLPDGTYTFSSSYSVSKNDLKVASIDKNVGTDISNYTTWGTGNYEIVRVTPEIAKQMGWSDTTIGMYTVHRKSATDAYCGTTFTSAKDHANGQTFGYQEYGTLYYTQANLGMFAIVERTAPSDATLTGYLGNYSDRDYDYLEKEGAASEDKQSSTTDQKNYDGEPAATADSMSTVKYVHYIDLCTDTNQYGTYMLTDGYDGYDDTYYSNYVETLDDADNTPTLDGYDALIFDQSSLVETIGLEHFTLEGPVNDVLNKFWDNWFSNYLTENSGIQVIRNSKKTDTWFSEKEKTDVLHHYVGTTINHDSFDDNDSTQSDITYEGTYTDTSINYNSYAGEAADALNARDGFNRVEYLQVGNITYDNAAEEKNARYYHTESEVNKDAGYAFIDEREYGYIRFSKYDTDAERYVDGNLDAAYVSGTDHADADLDGAVYSLYVDESNSFTVEYLEGNLDGKIFWAQPLNTGGYRVIYDGDDNSDNGFTDLGTNVYEDYPHAWVSEKGILFLDYTDADSASAAVSKKTQAYKGLQHPDGQYGGAKHNGYYAVLEEQQIFLDTNNDGYADTWTLQDVTLYDGAKVASAVIRDGELSVDGLYLGTYYLAEEIRDAITIHSTDNDDKETSENRWLSFAPGYTADTDEHGNPTHYVYRFPYTSMDIDGTKYEAEQDYVHKDTKQVSNQQVVKGQSLQLKKVTTKESSASTATTQEALEGAGFTVYLISELSLIKDGTITPAYSEEDGHALVEGNVLVKLFDESGNMVGYQFTKRYMEEAGIHAYFDEKYGEDYNLTDVNRIVYVKDHGYYYIQDILDAYKDSFYDEHSLKWDFTEEESAVVRIYEEDAEYIQDVNRGYAYIKNYLNSGSPCEYYGQNGRSDGWVATDVKNEYQLAEIYSNHYGNIRIPELAWGAYIVVETTTPTDVFTVDPYFYTITDSSASANRAKTVALSDAPFVASMVLTKRDAQSGQDVLMADTSYRIWDYTNHMYVSKYLLGENGGLSMVSQRVFKTDDTGRVNAVASLEKGSYRIEELTAPYGTHNQFWDYGDWTKGELLGGQGTDSEVPTLDNMFQKYYGTMDFEITTERLYKSSGIVSSDNLDYIYVGETYYNDEVQGKLTISKTGEVLVGYRTTDDIEYADEYTDASDTGFNYSKSMMRDRAVFESMKDYYDLGTDSVEEREITFDIKADKITPVKYLAMDQNGMYIAAIYEDGDVLTTLSGGTVYMTGCYLTTGSEDDRTYYPGAVVENLTDTYVYSTDGTTWYAVTKVTDSASGTSAYYDPLGAAITSKAIINSLQSAVLITAVDGTEIYAPAAQVTSISQADQVLMIVYDLTIDTFENVDLKEAENTYIYTVSGDRINTSYLVTDKDGVLLTNDYGVLTDNGNGSYTITYTEAIYDPDINYNYTLTLSDGSTKAVKLVTDGIYLSKDNEIIRVLEEGFSIEDSNGSVVTDQKATLAMAEENTGETFDFVYEERRLAGATYVVKAAEDIVTQDGGEGNLWFQQGDIVATVTTANDGEFVSFAPAYNQGGTYDATYYYGNSAGSYTSLTQQMSYSADEFATTGSVDNKWTSDKMSALDLSIYGLPAYTDATIYPNSFYRENVQKIYRRFVREGVSDQVLVTDYQTRLEANAGRNSEGYGVLTATPDGFNLTYEQTISYKGAKLTQNGDYYLLTGKGQAGDDITIEVEESSVLYEVTDSATLPWAAGDYVEKTGSGYRIVHTDSEEAGVDHGSLVDGAKDLGYTTSMNYPSATITDNGDGTFTLYDQDESKIVIMKSGLLVTEAGGIVKETADGYSVTYTQTEEYTANQYVTPSLLIKGAELTIKDETYDLTWDSANEQFTTSFGTTVSFSDDFGTVTVTTDGVPKDYTAFDMLVTYDLHYAAKENIVSVEKNGTLGTVSLYLPLGRYTVQEIATPYGFLLNEQPQEVEFSYVDQVKEVVFNSEESSIVKTQNQINTWVSKALTWFVGGVNTVGEKLNDIFETDHFVWGTYGDAEDPYYTDSEGFINIVDLRVKAWSQAQVPETPDGEKGPGDVSISKQDITSKAELPGADLIVEKDGKVIAAWTSTDTPHTLTGLADGTYTLIELTAPDGYTKAESITFVMENGYVAGGSDVVMYDAPDDGKIYISKQDVTTKEELPGAELIVEKDGKVIASWTSADTPHTLTGLADGTYTLTENRAPDGYVISESITFEVKDGKVSGGTVVMYDGGDSERHEESEETQWKLGVGIYKNDKETKEELSGAKFGLYTSDDIYNVDGKLIAPKGTKLAVATTDKTGFANFAVDIALLSKWTDPEAKDDTLVYDKSVTYTYDSVTDNGDGTYLVKADGCKDLLLTQDASGIYLTEGGHTAVLNTADQTVSYQITESIDGNTAVNTGCFYIQEITPPDGYLYDDTIYDVKFAYQDDKTMYIPVYAVHQNEQTKVTLNKMDLTGQEEVPGATVSVYKVKDINNVDADGLVSHEDDNLYLIDKWTSTDTAHEVEGLLLSNTEWPRLNNQQVRENLYVFREEIPASGYVSARDIEFKLYQKQGEDGWIDSETNAPYGYEVLVNAVTCDQDYESGSIISANEHPDSWILNGTDTESKWDYAKVLDGYTEVKWLLVNENLVLFFSDQANKETIQKILKEEDFTELDFDTVYLEFGSAKGFDVDFYKDKQVNTRPADSYITYTQMWYSLDDLEISMYDDVTKLSFTKQDLVTGEDVLGAKLQILDANGKVIDSWTTGTDTHYIEGQLNANTTYTLVETLAPTADGYVKTNSVKFTVLDDGSIQAVVMEDDFTKLEISKADITTGKEVDGAVLEVWSVDSSGKRIKRYDQWTTGQDGYDKQGYPNRHYIDYLPVGNYVLVETMAPQGYLTSEDVAFTIAETGLLQKVQMFDAASVLRIYKYQTGTKNFVKGATIQVYAIPEQYISYLTEPIRVETDAKITEPDGSVTEEEKSSIDLADYMVSTSAEGTEHRSAYTTKLILTYTMLRSDIDAMGRTYQQKLPKEIQLNDEDLGTHEVMDGDEKAFTYTIDKASDGTYGITLTYAVDYVAATEDYDTYNFYLSMEATIDESALRGDGSLKVAFTDEIDLLIPVSAITEVSSSVNEPVTTIHLTSADLRATVVTENKASTIQGLAPGWYVAMETKAPSGYILDSTPQVFQLQNAATEQALTFYNTKKASSGGSKRSKSSTPETPVVTVVQEPAIGKLTLWLNGGNGFSWPYLLPQTEDNGEAGSSILFAVEQKRSFPYGIMASVLFGIAFVCGGVVLVLYRKKREDKQK